MVICPKLIPRISGRLKTRPSTLGAQQREKASPLYAQRENSRVSKTTKLAILM